MITEVSARNFILQSIDTDTLNLGEAKYMFLLIKAHWCHFCEKYMPEYEDLSAQFPQAHFLSLEFTTPENQILVRQWAGLAHPVLPQQLKFPTVVLYSGSGTPLKVLTGRSREFFAEALALR